MGKWIDKSRKNLPFWGVEWDEFQRWLTKQACIERKKEMPRLFCIHISGYQKLPGKEMRRKVTHRVGLSSSGGAQKSDFLFPEIPSTGGAKKGRREWWGIEALSIGMPIFFPLWSPSLWPTVITAIPRNVRSCLSIYTSYKNLLIIYIKFLKRFQKHQWSSGRIVPCHGTDPGSIPGWCNCNFWNSFFLFDLIEALDSEKDRQSA